MSSEVLVSGLPRRIERGREIDRRLKRLDGRASSTWRNRSMVLLAELFDRLAARLPAATPVQCGAHGAEATIRFRRAHPSARAFAIEANPRTFAELTRRAESEGVTTICVGLGAQEGRAVLLIPEQNSASMASFKTQVKARGRVIEELEVPVTTVDALDREHGFEGPIALWIDVEGATAEVLRGAGEVLRRTDLVIVELQDGAIWHEQTTSDEVHRLLASHGLTLVARDWQTGDRLYNGLFVRDSFAADAAPLVSRYWEDALRAPRFLPAGIASLGRRVIARVLGGVR